MNVVLQSYDLSEDYLRFAAQIGADGVDISPRRGWAELVPGVADRGYADERGVLPTDGGYEEGALHDGDMNMFRVLRALESVEYDGGLQVDHLPHYTGDNAVQAQAAADAVGCIKALLTALDVE